ncbi:MAG: signal peptidase II [Actinomycetota bacterium]
MDRVHLRGAAILFGSASVVFLFDRVTKLWAERSLADAPIDLVPGVLSLRFTSNSGGAFSLGQSAPWVFAGASIAVSAAIAATAFRHRDRAVAVALGLVLGGALGNLADRAIRGPGLSGRVVDFVDLHLWPVFNLADAAIVVGALLLAWSSVRAGGGAKEPVHDG